jgi:SAM-dependent methyltransferase
MINPSLFHLHHIERDEDVSFWLQLAIEVDGPVLELGCGTGRLLLPLLKSGINLCGLDRNYEMLSYLNSQLPNQFLGQVKTFQADLGYFHLDREFSLIFLACNTLSTLQEKTRKSGFSRIYEHLNDKGVFAVSVPNPVHLASLPVLGEPEIEATFSHPSSGNPIQVSSEWRRFERYIDFSWHYDHLLPDGLIERQTVQSRHNMISLGEYKGELREAHLDLINLYGDYDKAIYQDDSPYLIMITRKTPGF